VRLSDAKLIAISFLHFFSQAELRVVSRLPFTAAPECNKAVVKGDNQFQNRFRTMNPSTKFISLPGQKVNPMPSRLARRRGAGQRAFRGNSTIGTRMARIKNEAEIFFPSRGIRR
jgi:hypothetical protein